MTVEQKLEIALNALEKILPEYADAFDNVSIEMGSSIMHDRDETYLMVKDAIEKIKESMCE